MQKLNEAVDKHKELILATEKFVWEHPETGIKNFLLSDNGARAKKIIEEFRPQFASKEEYLAFVDGINASGDRIEYSDGDVAKVKIG